MSNAPDPKTNPYQSPATEAAPVAVVVADADLELVKNFREQIVALGAAWILIGLLAIGVFVYLLTSARASDLPPNWYLGIMFGVSTLWVIAGGLTCVRVMPAIYAGLVLSYLSALSLLLQFSVIALVLIGIVIYQAHRVLGFASEMHTKGIPLDV